VVSSSPCFLLMRASFRFIHYAALCFMRLNA
jgi:hypothetical protein